jgi:hypothetical protein
MRLSPAGSFINTKTNMGMADTILEPAVSKGKSVLVSAVAGRRNSSLFVWDNFRSLESQLLLHERWVGEAQGAALGFQRGAVKV